MLVSFIKVCNHTSMKFFLSMLVIFFLCSCDSMEISAQEQTGNPSPCAACEECGKEGLEVDNKPTS